MNAYSPHISETRRRLLNERAEDTRTDDEKLIDALGYMKLVQERKDALYARYPNSPIPEKAWGQVEKLGEDAEAQIIGALEELGVTGDNIALLRDMLALCDLSTPQIGRAAA